MAHRSFATLTTAGFSTEQAEAIIATVESGTRDLVTKADLQAAMQALELRLTLRMGAMVMSGVVVTLGGVAAITRL